MSLSLDTCVTFYLTAWCHCPQKRGGFMGEGTSGWKGILGVEPGKIWSSLSLYPPALAL